MYDLCISSSLEESIATKRSTSNRDVSNTGPSLTLVPHLTQLAQHIPPHWWVWDRIETHTEKIKSSNTNASYPLQASRCLFLTKLFRGWSTTAWQHRAQLFLFDFKCLSWGRVADSGNNNYWSHYLGSSWAGCLIYATQMEKCWGAPSSGSIRFMKQVRTRVCSGF